MTDQKVCKEDLFCTWYKKTNSKLESLTQKTPIHPKPAIAWPILPTQNMTNRYLIHSIKIHRPLISLVRRIDQAFFILLVVHTAT